MGSKSKHHRSRTNEVIAIVFIALAVLMLLSLVTYDPKDPSWNSVGPQQRSANLIGVFGAYLSAFLLSLFGLAALFMPILMSVIAVRIFFAEELAMHLRKIIGAVFLLIANAGFFALFPKIAFGWLRHSASNGGMIGYLVEGWLAAFLNTLGAAIVLAVVFTLTLMWTMEVSVASIALKLGMTRTLVSKISVAGLLAPVKGWWAARAEKRRQELIALRAAKAEEFKRKEQERLVRDSETGVEKPPRRKPLAGQVEEAKRLKDEPGIAVEPVITPVIAKTFRADAVDENLADDFFDDAPLFEEPLAARHPAAPVSRRTQAAAALRAYKNKTEQIKTPGQLAAEVTMDPDVVEMTSTAWIDRSMPLHDEAEVFVAPVKEVRAPRQPAIVKSANTDYALPSIDLLEVPIGPHEQAEEELRERATTLAEKCKEFSVVGHIHRINPGPVVTTFEFKPDPGIKYSRVVGLADDLCLALKAESIRIDRIPGKSTVGIEVPNLHREKILLREVIESPKFKNSESKLTIALGKTINGEEYTADLSRMPHLLIAGATGAGKSVTMNALICSILYKASPEEVKFIMVDPKRVELGLYENIPHLLTPIVTDPKRAANALKWAVNEMETRYKELAKYGVRNIEQYNRQAIELNHPTLSVDDPNAMKPLPYIIIAIDELADLMMVAKSEVETSIARLAQMARAVGIHLVLATQRPSVDIITGVIKANIPSRISFRVSSKVDSRTIIDANGAEALLGQGDMLFLPPGTSRLIRVHGSFVNEKEVKEIADHARRQAEPAYDDKVTMNEQEAEGLDGEVGERDELYDQALAIVTDMGRASTSVLQRRLSVGYGRAAKILDMMEREGFIGPAEGAKPRKVLGAAFEFRERLGQRLEEDFD
ncbi:MAG: DNA translocase FtsK [Acidobacteria bacterium]|nr:DNA translocase FtsK [Acidobacteriota bacterium]